MEKNLMIKSFWYFAKSSWAGIVLSIILSCLTVISAVALMGVSAYLIILAGFHPSIAVLQVSIVGVRFFGITRSIFRYLERLQTHKVNFEILGTLRLSVFSKLSDHYYQFVDRYTSSDFLSIVINDINQMENLFVRLLSPAIVALLISVLVGIYLGFQAIEIFYIYLLGYILTGIIIPFFSIKTSRMSKGKLEYAQKKYQSSVINFNQFLDEAIFYQAQSKLKIDLENSVQSLEKEQTRTVIWQSVWQLLSFYSIQAIYISILAISIYLANKGKLEFLMVGVIFLVVLTSFEVLSNIPSMAYLYGDIERSSIRIREIEKISTKPHENSKLFEKDIFPIRFENVSFAYPSYHSHLVIENINFEIQRGEKIAIVGMNGSGKTTLIELLMGLRNDYGGSILLGDQELKTIRKQVLSQRFGYLSVNPFMFATSVRQNLLLAKGKAGDDELIQTLHEVNLYQPPDLTLDMQLDEFGKNLSSGEIQRLAIAQSILVDTDVQIYDEPFANLDPESAFKIDRLIHEKFKDKTMIFVTHRYINMDIFDNIYVLDEGNIVQSGHHRELMKQPGKYSELLRISNY